MLILYKRNPVASINPNCPISEQIIPTSHCQCKIFPRWMPEKMNVFSILSVPRIKMHKVTIRGDLVRKLIFFRYVKK